MQVCSVMHASHAEYHRQQMLRSQHMAVWCTSMAAPTQGQASQAPDTPCLGLDQIFEHDEKPAALRCSSGCVVVLQSYGCREVQGAGVGTTAVLVLLFPVWAPVAMWCQWSRLRDMERQRKARLVDQYGNPLHPEIQNNEPTPI